MLPQLQLQWTAEATLSNAFAWRTLVNDSSLVAWFHTRDQCPAATLSALIAQREQLPECYARLVKGTAQDLMFLLFERA
jgi:hypothetical protein